MGNQFLVAIFISLFIGLNFSVSPVHAQAPQIPPTVELKRDIVYATRDGVALKMDICLPKNLKEQRPAVIFTHGGGFRTGDKIALLEECLNVSKEGYIGATVNYRLQS
ncbi:carboxylesterase family protein [Candidatus Gottesmanbacteria bacterium]|nr:carboxylesterase family protein [Candidatus Gottesmanbacteria bacterium]